MKLNTKGQQDTEGGGECAPCLGGGDGTMRVHVRGPSEHPSHGASAARGAWPGPSGPPSRQAQQVVGRKEGPALQTR